MSYGKELILDLYDCDPATFNQVSIVKWLDALCERIGMVQEDLHFWDYEGCDEERAKAPEHLVGTSAVQFITTSNIIIHTVDLVRECYINLFTCKDFDVADALDFTTKWFGSSKFEYQVIERGKFTKCRL
jgi:S-adenosylmethionine/arginine decarboxylase-like enzyme